MEMQMITLTQHVPEWCNDFTPGVWQVESKDGLMNLPIMEYFIKQCAHAGYDRLQFMCDSEDNLIACFKKDSPFPHEAEIIIGKVDNIAELLKIMMHDQVHI
jgi:hypothetical protein